MINCSGSGNDLKIITSPLTSFLVGLQRFGEESLPVIDTCGILQLCEGGRATLVSVNRTVQDDGCNSTLLRNSSQHYRINTTLDCILTL